MVDYYEILGVKQTDSNKKIYKIFQEKVFPLHPDNPKQIHTNKNKLIKLNEAYFVLGDMDNRAPYDLIYKKKMKVLKLNIQRMKSKTILSNGNILENYTQMNIMICLL